MVAGNGVYFLVVQRLDGDGIHETEHSFLFTHRRDLLERDDDLHREVTIYFQIIAGKAKNKRN